MGRKPAKGPKIPGRKKKDVPLFRVFLTETNLPAYLEAGKGLELEEAERLSKGLQMDTYIKQVYEPEEEEE